MGSWITMTAFRVVAALGVLLGSCSAVGNTPDQCGDVQILP